MSVWAKERLLFIGTRDNHLSGETVVQAAGFGLSGIMGNFLKIA